MKPSGAIAGRYSAPICAKGNCALKRTMKEGKSFVSSAYLYHQQSPAARADNRFNLAAERRKRGKILGGVETFRDHSLVEELRRELAGQFQVGDMVSRSKAMKRIFNILPQVAESDSTVLIEGETGTGKELYGPCHA